ncbi:MAG: hypothetical protein HC843_10820 [Sphingomonadales bacterium]|nr:hypothetical protein [Sphingomonadales bacterium]
MIKILTISVETETRAIFVIASEAKQSSFGLHCAGLPRSPWLLAMTVGVEI